MTAPFRTALLLLALLALRTTRAQQVAPTGLADSAIALLSRAPIAGPAGVYDAPVAILDQLLLSDPGDEVALHYKGYALYRKAASLSGDRTRKSEYKETLQEAEKVLALATRHGAWPETLALQSAVVGQLIGVSGILAIPRLGPKTNRLMDEAIAMAPSNPRVWLLKGILSIHKPKGFGGGLDNAERDLRKAIELFPADNAVAPRPSWGHAEAWAWLGSVHAGQKRVDEARAAYTRALELQPDFDWVRQHLLPALDPDARQGEPYRARSRAAATPAMSARR